MRLTSGRAASARRQIQIGQQLALEKQLCFASGRIWKEYVQETFNLSRERADELIRIGVGRLTVEESRTSKRKSQQTSRQRQDKNEPAKNRFLICLSSSVDRSDQARRLIETHDFSKEDKIEMSKAVTDMILAWQRLSAVLK